MTIKKGGQIFLKEEDRTDAVRDYRRIGNEYEVLFKSGKIFKYQARNVRIVEPIECFTYLRRIADAVGLKTTAQDGKIINSLAHNYSKITTIYPDSIFGAYLTGKQFSDKASKYQTNGERSSIHLVLI